MNTNFQKIDEFYPTPKELLDKITTEIRKSYKINTILEPSAGKGDIVKYIEENFGRYGDRKDIDCIEKDEDLQNTLRGAGYKVVGNDFLTYNTFKHYDLIIMNPPFSNGDEHLLKALHMQKDGGAIICILNAETLKNPCTNRRKDLLKKLSELNASIEYMEEEFVAAERSTSVEIAVIKVDIPNSFGESVILNNLKKRYYNQDCFEEATDIALNDYIKSSVLKYNIEVEAGIKLIREYYALCPSIQNQFNSEYSHPMLELKVNGYDANINEYVKLVRTKYWEALFKNKKFTGNMTSNQYSVYASKIKELVDYDFSEYNIEQIRKEMEKNLIRGIEDCIMELFDELSRQYAYYETSENVHYYNGWKTNKAWIINKKVIIPFYHAFEQSYYDNSKKFNPTSYDCIRKLSDIEKALNYLDTGRTCYPDIAECMEAAKKHNTTRKIPCKYFNITFYKKGTCHIEFTDEELLKKFNIFGSQQKGWLPQNYGKAAYSDLTEEEKAVVDDFEGEESYNKIMDNKDFYIYNPNNILSIEQTA